MELPSREVHLCEGLRCHHMSQWEKFTGTTGALQQHTLAPGFWVWGRLNYYWRDELWQRYSREIHLGGGLRFEHCDHMNDAVERNSLEVEVGHLRWDNKHSTHLGTPVHSGMPHFVLCCESKHKYKYNQRYKYKYRANTNIKQRYKYKYTLLRTLPCCEWTMHIAQLLCTLPGDLALVMHTFTLPSLIGTLFYKHSFLKFVKVFLTCTQKCHIQSS